MPDESADPNRQTETGESETLELTSVVVGAWSALKTVYYANSLSWRFLKSGTLIFFGFFLWAGANILYSYNPELTLLQYPMAYGFLLIVYGPIHHLVVLPLAFRWRRATGFRQPLGKRGPNAMLALFLVAVVVLGTFPAGPMVVDFQSALGSNAPDVSPDLLCTKSTTGNGTSVHCHLTESKGIDHIVVRSGTTDLVVDESPPFEFTIHEEELQTVAGEKRFTVMLQDENGDLIRRYTRRLSMVEEG